MKMPMRIKYIDEIVGVWCEFGTSPDGVDITDGTSDVFTGIPKELAEKVVRAQEKFRKELYEILGS